MGCKPELNSASASSLRMKTEIELGLGLPKWFAPQFAYGFGKLRGRRSRPQAKSAKAPRSSQAGKSRYVD